MGRGGRVKGGAQPPKKPGGGLGNKALFAGGLAAFTLPGILKGGGGGGVLGGLGGALGQLGSALAWVLEHPQETVIGVVGTIVVLQLL